MAIAAVGVGVGCATSLESQGTLPVAVTIEAVPQVAGGVVVISATLRNLTTEDLTLRVRCTPIELELDQNGTWTRIEDFRSCAPPDRTTLRAGQMAEVEDQRSLGPGRYRVVIESIDGRAAYSEPFPVTPQS
jgi:hypothetical protein